MAEILPTLLQFPAESSKKKPSAKEYDTQITAFYKEINKINAAAFSKPCDKKNLLEMLDPATNSLAYAVTLVNQISNLGKDNKRVESLLTTYAVPFFYQFDPVQMRYAGEEWRDIWEAVHNMVYQQSSSDIDPLVTGLLRLDPTAGTFTHYHLRIVRLALRTGVPSQALPILDKSIHAYPHKHTQRLPHELACEDHEFSSAFITQNSNHSLDIKPEYVLEYYYLGGSVYLALSNFVRARLFLEHVLLSPTAQKANTASWLQVEAYQKWLLLGLIVDGKQFPYPKTMDQTVMKNIRSTASHYDALVADFEKRDVKKYAAEVEVGGKVWSDDGNFRLVTECGFALLRYKIIDLQKTYAALPIARVADLMDMNIDSAFALVHEMINTGYLRAQLSHAGPDAVLTFFSSEAKLPEKSGESTDLEQTTKRIKGIVASIRDADRRTQLTREYVDAMRRGKKNGMNEEDPMDLEYDLPQIPSQQGEDEDLMQ